MLSTIRAFASRNANASMLKSYATRGMSTSFDVSGSYSMHNMETAPNDTVESSKEELTDWFEKMYLMRRMEIACDNEYKARNIRGFCHLYDGQEAVCMGTEAAFDHEDSWITSYRCHAIALMRGGTVESIMGEMFGLQSGMTKAKGGSMHYYSKKDNFYGGQGIVGAQVPVGTGLAFANKYKSTPGERMPVAMAAYGDGAANQGQIWESANMAALWKLPMIFCIENNHYGMGTSVERHSSHQEYYKMGNHIPGIRIDGMNVLAVKEGMRFVKDYVGAGNGPMYVEMMTYRYHGHSMSDPGTTYRTRDEIAATRSARDPLEFIKTTMLDAGFATPEELKKIEKKIKKDVQKAIMKAKESSPPPKEELFSHIYSADHKIRESEEKPKFIRMPTFDKSIHN
mmetsp:Transcript_35167/g.51650  ORF Transcript_35167/g.51650 Transcript_35167/m.51650 type:complete len:398 (+) Transcript_35167:120-1313(+)|eukprot:CAMPEP_0195516470 /NCGR_PEP_ID=MMETSP0794_2-20130614/7186_1 /TAXON_ID=515487 /ORGANISM="Stephanopyxis turris, Strain CCMP 815" /LENGTH=397 /DNA_ID=CAMNT_0040645069 /DNA_START=107 /DNA_END=1300 /DNA_ORIENTATION=-